MTKIRNGVKIGLIFEPPASGRLSFYMNSLRRRLSTIETKQNKVTNFSLSFCSKKLLSSYFFSWFLRLNCCNRITAMFYYDYKHDDGGQDEDTSSGWQIHCYLTSYLQGLVKLERERERESERKNCQMYVYEIAAWS